MKAVVGSFQPRCVIVSESRIFDTATPVSGQTKGPVHRGPHDYDAVHHHTVKLCESE